jgi:hypothetical protein
MNFAALLLTFKKTLLPTGPCTGKSTVGNSDSVHDCVIYPETD